MKKNFALLSIFTIFYFTTNSIAQEISKSGWVNYMTSAVPNAFCQEEQYFRQCFEISESSCLETARKAMKICMNKEDKKLPESLDHATGKKWGKIIGNCVGNEFCKIQINNKSKDQKCYNPANWMKKTV